MNIISQNCLQYVVLYFSYAFVSYCCENIQIYIGEFTQ